MNRNKSRFHFSKLPAIIGAVFFVVLSAFFFYRLISREHHKADLYDRNHKLRYLTYGKSLTGLYKGARDIIAAKYGLVYEAVAGCMVNQALVDSVQDHNELVEQITKNKFGKNWHDNFENDLIAEVAKQRALSELITNQPYIKICQSNLGDGEALSYYMEPRAGGKEYSVTVSGWKSWKKDDEILKEHFTFFSLSINTETHNIKILSNKAKKI